MLYIHAQLIKLDNLLPSIALKSINTRNFESTPKKGKKKKSVLCSYGPEIVVLRDPRKRSYLRTFVFVLGVLNFNESCLYPVSPNVLHIFSM